RRGPPPEGGSLPPGAPKTGSKLLCSSATQEKEADSAGALGRRRWVQIVHALRITRRRVPCCDPITPTLAPRISFFVSLVATRGLGSNFVFCCARPFFWPDSLVV